MKEVYGNSPSLMELVVSKNNMERAAEKVKSNKGAPGIDGMTVLDMYLNLMKYLEIKPKLMEKKYKPSPVRKVEIPKDNG